MLGLRRALLYVGKRLVDRFIDIGGLAIGVIALIVGWTTAAEVVNVTVGFPPSMEILVPSELLTKLTELADRCLEQCWSN